MEDISILQTILAQLVAQDTLNCTYHKAMQTIIRPSRACCNARLNFILLRTARAIYASNAVAAASLVWTSQSVSAVSRLFSITKSTILAWPVVPTLISAPTQLVSLAMLPAKLARILPLASAAQSAISPTTDAKALVLWGLIKTISITHAVLAMLDALLA